MVKKALLMGINYINNPPRFLLQGCYTDLEWSKDVITTVYNFPEENIRTYKDEEGPGVFGKPDRQGMLDAIKWLVADAQPGDTLFFHFSGHGIQVANDTAKDKDLAGGLQEALCPSDIEWSSGHWKNYVSTYELKEMLEPAIPKGCLLLCIFDCCHSGTTLRDADFEGYIKPRCLPTNLDLDMAGKPQVTPPATRSLNDLEKERSYPEYAILLAGAASKQTAADAQIDGKKCGAFSCYLYQALKNNPTITYDALIKQVKINLKEKRFSQIPQIDATEDKDSWVFMSLGGSGGGLHTDSDLKASTPGSTDVSATLNSVLNGYGTEQTSRGLDDCRDRGFDVNLSDLLQSSKLKIALNKLSSHGVKTLVGVSKMSSSDWEFVGVGIGIKNRLLFLAKFAALLDPSVQSKVMKPFQDYLANSNVLALRV